MNEALHTWNFPCHGIKVKEMPFDYDRHKFAVYRKNKCLGVIYPDDTIYTKSCHKDLAQGKCPVCESWEDGLGNTVTMNGWGK